MKTLIGHLGGQALSPPSKVHPPFFRSLDSGLAPFPRTLKTPAPFTPLRQPVGGHGNFRKEHRAS